jgi:hypothetical protein
MDKYICLLAEYDINHGEMNLQKVGIYNSKKECEDEYSQYLEDYIIQLNKELDCTDDYIEENYIFECYIFNLA